MENFDPVKELASKKGSYVSISSSSSDSSETVVLDIESPLPLESPSPDSSINLSIVTHEVTDTDSDGDETPVTHKKFKGNVETPTVPQAKSSDELKKKKKDVCHDYIRENCNRHGHCSKDVLKHKIQYHNPVQELAIMKDTYVSISSSSSESSETVDLDIPLPLESPSPDSSINLSIVTHEVTDTDSDSDESPVTHKRNVETPTVPQEELSDELKKKKKDVCHDYIRENCNRHGHCSKDVLKHKIQYHNPVQELAIMKDTYVSISSSSSESSETVDPDIQSPLPLESPLPDSSINVSVVTHEVTDTNSDSDESPVTHKKFQGNVETPTVSQEELSDELKKKKEDVCDDYIRENCNRHGHCSKDVLKHKIQYHNPVQELAIMKDTYVSISSSSSESSETVDPDIQSPLPLESPSPDSSINLSIVTHEVIDTDSDSDESPATHKKFKGNVETPTVPQEKSSDELQKKKEDVCNDYNRENCNQHGNCSKNVLKHKIEYNNPGKELAIMKGTYVSKSSSSSEISETGDPDIQPPLPLESPLPDSSFNVSVVTHEITDTDSDSDETPVTHKKFKGNVKTPTVPQEKSSDELKKKKEDVCNNYNRENCNQHGNCSKNVLKHKIQYNNPVKELAIMKGTYVSKSSSSSEIFETGDPDIQPPLPLESPFPDSSFNVSVVTHEITDTDSDSDETPVTHKKFKGNVETPTVPQEKSSDELKKKKEDLCNNYNRENCNQHGNCSKNVLKHKIQYNNPVKELAIMKGTYVSKSSSSSEIFETGDPDIQPPLSLESPLPDSSFNVSVVTHEITDTDSDSDETPVTHKKFKGNVETPTVPQKKSSDKLKKKKKNICHDYIRENCNQHGNCSKKVLKQKMEYFDPVKELAIMKGTYVSTSSSSSESSETVDPDIQPPLPLESPPPDSSINLSIVTHEVTDTDCDESPTRHENLEGNVETATVPQDNSSDKLKKNKKYVCRDYIRGNCNRQGNCKFSHEYNLTHLEGVYTFCHKFQNSVCTYANCKYVHADVFEERNFYRTGILPPYALAHIRTADSPPPEPQFPLEEPRLPFSSPNYCDPPPPLHIEKVWPRLW